MVSKAICTGVIGLNDGLLDVFSEEDIAHITTLIQSGGNEVVIEGMAAISRATINTNLLIAIGDKNLQKVKALTEWGADLSRLDKWNYKTFADYTEVREILQIIAYLNSKGAQVTVGLRNDLLLESSANGDLDVVKLLCHQGVSQKAKDEALYKAKLFGKEDVQEYLVFRGAEMPQIIDPFALRQLLLQNNPYYPLADCHNEVHSEPQSPVKFVGDVFVEV